MNRTDGPSNSSQAMPARYRIDIVKDGAHWADPVGLTATADTIAAIAVGLAAEAAVESRPLPGQRCYADVFDENENFVIRAELRISDRQAGTSSD